MLLGTKTPTPKTEWVKTKRKVINFRYGEGGGGGSVLQLQNKKIRGNTL